MQGFGRGKGHDGVTEMIAINANCLDEVDLAMLEIKDFNGRDL